MTTPGYRLHPRLLAHPWFRRLLLAGWLAGAAAIWWDATTGPFTRLFFPPALLLCLVAAWLLLWGYRHILLLLPLALMLAPGAAAALALPDDEA